uniref:Uncharacterized protein n=1 Tax=Anopheles melas TaxID=34690 RepID=A0A182TYE3_9DIPT
QQQQQQHHHHTRPTPPPASDRGGSSASGSIAVVSSPSPFPAAPLFATPIPPPTSVSLSSPAGAGLSVASAAGGGSSGAAGAGSQPPSQPPTAPHPHPFSAESLFSTKVSDQADMLRRELDNRFLDRSGLTAGPPGPPYLRQELHHHQHQHTHLHQHQHQPMLPGAAGGAPTLFPPPLFKDVPKIGAVDSPFYRTGIGMPAYPGYPPGLLHPGLSGPTQFVPPSHLQSFVPKVSKREEWGGVEHPISNLSIQSSTPCHNAHNLFGVIRFPCTPRFLSLLMHSHVCVFVLYWNGVGRTKTWGFALGYISEIH